MHQFPLAKYLSIFQQPLVSNYRGYIRLELLPIRYLPKRERKILEHERNSRLIKIYIPRRSEKERDSIRS